MPNEKKPKTKYVEYLRHAEYYDMQSTFDELYARSQAGEIFDGLMDVILSRAVRKVKQTIRFCLQNRIPISLPQVTGGERVSNGLPGQTVKGRNCNTEEGGCFGNAEAPDDDHCNPAHVWNFSFLVCP